MKKNNLLSPLVMQAPKNFCAIDASTHSMAFAYFLDHKLKKYGKIRFSGEKIYDKIGDTSAKVWQFFQECPTENILIEKTIFANSPMVAANLALSQGALIGSAKLAKVSNVYGVTPMSWQNFIGTRLLSKEEKDQIRFSTPGKSNSWYKSQEREKRKQKTISTVNKYFSIAVDDNDIADACGIGMFALKNWEKVVKDEK
jgi:Holliday junction resolvasome RuvABC endonuclease subunit